MISELRGLGGWDKVVNSIFFMSPLPKFILVPTTKYIIQLKMFYTNCSDLFLSVGVIIRVDLSPHSLSVLSSRNISLIHYYKWNSIFISIFKPGLRDFPVSF